MCIEHQQWRHWVRSFMLLIARSDDIHWVMWQNVSTSIATNLETPKGHKMKATFVTKVITMINPCTKGWPWWGRKAAATRILCTTDVGTRRGPPVQALWYSWFALSSSHKSKRPPWHPMQWSTLLGHWIHLNANHDDCDCHNNSDVSTHAQDYGPIATE